MRSIERVELKREAHTHTESRGIANKGIKPLKA